MRRYPNRREEVVHTVYARRHGVARGPAQDLQSVVATLRGQILEISGRLESQTGKLAVTEAAFSDLRGHIATGNLSAGITFMGKDGHQGKTLRLLDPRTSQPDKFARDREKVRE